MVWLQIQQLFAKLRQVVELQGQVRLLENEVDQLERRRKLRLEEGEATVDQKCYQ